MGARASRSARRGPGLGCWCCKLWNLDVGSEDAVVDDLLSGWFGFFWLGLCLSSSPRMLFLVSWFLVSTVVEARTFPLLSLPGQNPWRHEGATPNESRYAPYLSPCAGA